MWGAYQWSLQNIKTKWIDFFYQNQQTSLFGPTEGKLSFFPERSITLKDGSEKNLNIT